jgi:prepilin-type processing-associated H-X9-DG protein
MDYGMNFVDGGYDRFPKLSRIKEPSTTIYLSDSQSSYLNPSSSLRGAILVNMARVDFRHPGKIANILWVDGSVRGARYKEISDYDRYWRNFWENQGPAVAEPAN